MPDGAHETGDPLSEIAQSLVASARRVAAIDAESRETQSGAEETRLRRPLHDAAAGARTILLEARSATRDERDRLTAKVDESHARIRALLADLDFGLPPQAVPRVPLALPAAPTVPLPPIVPPAIVAEPPARTTIRRPIEMHVVPPAPAPPVYSPAPSLEDSRPTLRLEPYPVPARRGRRFRSAPQPWSPAPWLKSLFRVPGDHAGLSLTRRRWAETFLWVRNVGVITVLFVVFQLWGTGVGQARTQRSLIREFRGAAPAAAETSSSDGTPAAAVPPPVPGKAVALLKIDKIGMEQAVVEGTGTDDLRKGPGHYRGTPLPGERGNVAIAGHRTTYGAPFHRLDDLQRGDIIQLVTRQRVIRYVVANKRVVGPSHRGAIQPTRDDRLTLTTCHPKYSASQRLIVIAALAPNPPTTSTGTTGTTTAAPVTLAAPSRRAAIKHIQTGGDAGQLLPTVGWGLLLLLVSLRARHMAWGRLQRHAYLLATPVVIALLVSFFERLGRLLPPNY